jgi:hypothetical protein
MSKQTLYEIVDCDLNLVYGKFHSKKVAFEYIKTTMSTDVFPVVIRCDDGEIMAIVWRGVMYLPVSA